MWKQTDFHKQTRMSPTLRSRVRYWFVVQKVALFLRFYLKDSISEIFFKKWNDKYSHRFIYIVNFVMCLMVFSVLGFLLCIPSAIIV